MIIDHIRFVHAGRANKYIVESCDGCWIVDIVKKSCSCKRKKPCKHIQAGIKINEISLSKRHLEQLNLF